MNGGDHPMQCPACNATERRPYREVPHGDSVLALIRCTECDSLYFDPPPRLDYTSHTAAEDSIRDYVESNASIIGLAELVLPTIANRPKGRLLDLGCGFGFGADVARRVAEWDVVGVEPSPYGELGSRLLGYRGVHEFVDASHPLTAERFDVIFSSEVVEHVHDPDSFVRLARSMLAPSGLLAIGTPCAAALDEGRSGSEELAIMSPGAHVLLFSERGFTDLLKRAGFRHVQLTRQGGSMMAYASDEPIELAKVDPHAAVIEYLQAVTHAPTGYDPLDQGLRYRLYRHLIDAGRYQDAVKIEGSIEFPDLTLAPIASHADYLQRYRGFAAVATYYRAMLNLNFTANYGRASELFVAAGAMCRQRILNAPASAVEESSLLWAAQFHFALAQFQQGDAPSAAWAWSRLLLADSPGLPPITREWRDRAARELRQRGLTSEIEI